ncbi:ATP-binding protein [Mangrovivirga sp. M17]|uniref:histidine kinase n=1 Tax=Mangrovivirga halotolerans TaxID=2993936 RepID=A0ABT3RW60_9BACT|nr:ATP-binding protein [Mangrovivirga halotolerans]MCX2746018.1 ATP-binding protein [Mangrovivirga halotolerans]
MNDRATHEYQIYSNAIRRIHEAFTKNVNDPERQVEELLLIGTHLFGMENASYVEIIDDSIFIRKIVSTKEDKPEAPQKILPYKDSMAEESMKSDEITIFSDLKSEKIPEKYKVYLQNDIRCFIHKPVTVFGQRKGLISWSGSHALKSVLLEDHLRDIILLISNSIGKVIELKTSSESRQQYRKELQKQMEQYLASEELNQMGVWYRDLKTNVVTSSKGALKAAGVDPVTNKSLNLDQALRLVHPDDIKEIVEKRKESYKTGKAYSSEFRIVNNGVEVWVLMKGEPVFDESGEVVAVRGTLQNIDEEKKLKQERDRYKSLLEEFVRSNPVPVAMFDTEMHYIMVSKRWLEDYDVDESIIGKNHYEVVPGVKDDWKKRHQEALRGKRMNKDNDFFQWPDGNISYISWAVGPWYYPDNEIGGIILYAEDVTELKKNELKIAEMANQLSEYSRQLEKSNTELENFASLIGHDLQEPLRKIKAFGDMLKRKNEEIFDDQSRELLDRMVDASGRMQDLVNKLLEDSRRSSGEKRRMVDASFVINNVLDDLELAISESEAKINIGLAANIYGSYQELYRLFQNVISNSLKYREKSRRLIIDVNQEIADDKLKIKVSDNGIGIDVSNNNALFEFFTRGKKDSGVQGYGIGLAACGKIMDSLGGEIRILPRENEGTIVELTFDKFKLKK